MALPVLRSPVLRPLAHLPDGTSLPPKSPPLLLLAVGPTISFKKTQPLRPTNTAPPTPEMQRNGPTTNFKRAADNDATVPTPKIKINERPLPRAIETVGRTAAATQTPHLPHRATLNTIGTKHHDPMVQTRSKEVHAMPTLPEIPTHPPRPPRTTHQSTSNTAVLAPTLLHSKKVLRRRKQHHQKVPPPSPNRRQKNLRQRPNASNEKKLPSLCRHPTTSAINQNKTIWMPVPVKICHRHGRSGNSNSSSSSNKCK